MAFTESLAEHYVPETLKRWLSVAVRTQASDLHLVAGFPPTLRRHGSLEDLEEPPLEANALHQLLEELCPEFARSKLKSDRSLDFAVALKIDEHHNRFRINLFYNSGILGACCRVIPESIPSFEWADFPIDLATRLSMIRDGLVVLTGPTGSGKSTTLAMIVNLINQEGGQRIISIEEPIEFEFPRVPHSVVSQREVGVDVPNFAEGLRNGLRQDPDVILVGEIRDFETAQIALSASETGHLVFTTLHSGDTKGGLTRFLDLFPNEVQRDIRSQLAITLRVIVAQRLLPDVVPGNKRHLALEVLWNTFPIASAIRTGKFESVENYLVTARDDGMISFDQTVRRLLELGQISRNVAEQNVRQALVFNR